MFLGGDGDSAFALLKLEQSDQVVAHELCADRTTDQGTKLGGAERDILFDLHDAQLIPATLRLDGKYVVGSSPVDSNVNLISFDLSDSWDAGPEMALE